MDPLAIVESLDVVKDACPGRPSGSIYMGDNEFNRYNGSNLRFVGNLSEDRDDVLLYNAT